MVGDVPASGNSVYETDDDIELAGETPPFGLKLMESLLNESPQPRPAYARHPMWRISAPPAAPESTSARGRR